NLCFKDNEKVVEDLCDFVENTHNENENSNARKFPDSRTLGLPTALVFSGKYPYCFDQAQFFEGVSYELSLDQQNHVVSLDPTHCTNLKAMMKNTVGKFLGTTLPCDDSDEEDEEFDSSNNFDTKTEIVNEQDQNDDTMNEDDNDEVLYIEVCIIVRGQFLFMVSIVFEMGIKDNILIRIFIKDAEDSIVYSIDDIIDMDSLAQWYEFSFRTKTDGLGSLLKLVVLIQDVECISPSVFEGYIHIC
ncbi:9590_t:CDS:2, partial [Acaulospora morrowiae]